MDYRTASMEQLRTERVRLTSMLQVFQQRHDSAQANRGGRNAGYRTNATAHQHERELERLNKQLAQLDAELVHRDKQAHARQPAADTNKPPAGEPAASNE